MGTIDELTGFTVTDGGTMDAIAAAATARHQHGGAVGVGHFLSLPRLRDDLARGYAANRSGDVRWRAVQQVRELELLDVLGLPGRMIERASSLDTVGAVVRVGSASLALRLARVLETDPHAPHARERAEEIVRLAGLSGLQLADTRLGRLHEE